MKKTIMAIIAAMTAFGALALDTSIAYQGVLRDDQGQILMEKQQTIEFRLYTQAGGGTPIWGRSMAVLLDANGLFNVELSDANGSQLIEATLSDALKSARGGSLYVGLTVAGSSGEISPRQKILSVPYAGYAADVSNASGDFTVTGKATLNNVEVSGTLTQSGEATFSEAVTFSKDVSIDGGLTVSANAAITGNGTIPIGGIILWSGSTVPDGWALCNGANGTPDLRGRFVMGVNALNEIGGTGGSANVTLSESNLPAHSHLYAGDDQVDHINGNGYNAGANVVGRPGGYDASSETKGGGTIYKTSSAGGGQSFSILPPYYKLAYIMRVK